MGCLWRPVDFLFVGHIALLICSTFLFLPFNQRGVSASSPYDHGPDMDLPGPPTTDYPTDAEIIEEFLGVERDDAVFYSDVGSPWEPLQYFTITRRKKWIMNVYALGLTFNTRAGRSERWHLDFVSRFARIFAERASGTVWLLSLWPDGPLDKCSCWTETEFPVLKENPNVEQIILVDYSEFDNQRVYWTRGDKEKPEENHDRDTQGNRKLSMYIRPPVVDVRAELMGPIAGGDTDLGTGLGDAIKTIPSILPAFLTPIFGPILGIPPINPQNTDDGKEQDNSIKTDVLPLKVGQAAEGDWTAFQVNDAGTWTTSERKRDVPKSRRRGISRSCSLNPNLNPDIFLQDPDPSYVLPAGSAGWAIVNVVQYARNDPDINPSPNFKLDITVFNSKGEKIGERLGSDAPTGQPVGVSSQLPYEILVTTQSQNEDTLLFAYAAGEGNWMGVGSEKWESNDQSTEHRCSGNVWKSGRREIVCKVTF